MTTGGVDDVVGGGSTIGTPFSSSTGDLTMGTPFSSSNGVVSVSEVSSGRFSRVTGGPFTPPEARVVAANGFVDGVTGGVSASGVGFSSSIRGVSLDGTRARGRFGGTGAPCWMSGGVRLPFTAAGSSTCGGTIGSSLSVSRGGGSVRPGPDRSGPPPPGPPSPGVGGSEGGRSIVSGGRCVSMFLVPVPPVESSGGRLDGGSADRSEWSGGRRRAGLMSSFVMRYFMPPRAAPRTAAPKATPPMPAPTNIIGRTCQLPSISPWVKVPAIAPPPPILMKSPVMFVSSVTNRLSRLLRAFPIRLSKRPPMPRMPMSARAPPSAPSPTHFQSTWGPRGSPSMELAIRLAAIISSAPIAAWMAVGMTNRRSDSSRSRIISMPRRVVCSAIASSPSVEPPVKAASADMIASCTISAISIAMIWTWASRRLRDHSPTWSPICWAASLIWSMWLMPPVAPRNAPNVCLNCSMTSSGSAPSMPVTTSA
ncbi:hypothetical protein OG417_53035 [Actinoallomurus sp. NBC_01490]|nr:hypothetical protein [Actinoallomurus sp. NBC_01490]